jgi:hypothetical protein
MDRSGFTIDEYSMILAQVAGTKYNSRHTVLMVHISRNKANVTDTTISEHPIRRETTFPGKLSQWQQVVLQLPTCWIPPRLNTLFGEEAAFQTYSFNGDG